MKDVAPAKSLTSCHMKLTALLFGEHDQAMDSHCDKCSKTTDSIFQTDMKAGQKIHFVSEGIV